MKRLAGLIIALVVWSFPFMPDGWAASAGGFPAMTERVAFLLKDLVLLAVSVYLLRQDVIRVSLTEGFSFQRATVQLEHNLSQTGVTRGQ
jgi:uncharacterized membrane protein YkgB